jgi:hypothetical protein
MTTESQLPESDDFKKATEQVEYLVDRPHESLSVELKLWLDPGRSEDRAKIIKAILALRNQDGGFLLIGFDNQTCLPVVPAPFRDIHAVFHQDVIQGFVSKYASHPFEIVVHFVERAGQLFPVIAIPGGTLVPAACKADLIVNSGGPSLRENDIYVRTLNANGVVSSAKASWKDLEALFARCFGNKEADYAGFLSKMFRGISPAIAKQIFSGMFAVAEEGANLGLTAKEVLSLGIGRFDSVLQERNVEPLKVAYWDVALRLQCVMPEWHPNQKFLQTLQSSNPDLTGWPVWLNSAQFFEEKDRPYLKDRRWEAFVYNPPDVEKRSWGYLDFMIFDPVGAFFLRRALQDDLGGSQHVQTFGKTVEPILQLLRVAEALLVGQAFSRALGCPDDTKLHFLFRWSGLKGRRLSPWSAPMQSVHGFAPSNDEEVSVTIVIPISAPEEVVIQQTHAAILPLTRVFGGYEISEQIVRHYVVRLLQRKL